MTTERTYDAAITHLANGAFFMHLADHGRALEGVADKAFFSTSRVNPTSNSHMPLVGTWMSERAFAAAPYSCHDEMSDSHILGS